MSFNYYHQQKSGTEPPIAPGNEKLPYQQQQPPPPYTTGSPMGQHIQPSATPPPFLQSGFSPQQGQQQISSGVFPQAQPQGAPTGPYTLLIQPEKSIYTLGETLRVNFILVLREPHVLSKIRLALLQIETVKGAQETVVLYSKTVHDAKDTNFMPRTYKFEMERMMTESPLPISVPHPTIPGQMMTIMAPPVSPDTLRLQPVVVGIRHVLMFEVERGGLFNSAWTQEMPVLIQDAPIYRLPPGYYNIPYRFQGSLSYKGFMGLSRGLIGLSINTDKTHYVAGENVVVDLYIDLTRASKYITRLELTLRRVIAVGKTELERSKAVYYEPLDTIKLEESTSKFRIPEGQVFGNRFTLRVPMPRAQISVLGINPATGAPYPSTSPIHQQAEVLEVSCLNFKVGFEIYLEFGHMLAKSTHQFPINVHQAIAPSGPSS